MKIYALAVPEFLVKRVNDALEAAGLRAADRPTQYLGAIPRAWLDVVDRNAEDMLIGMGMRE